uniref:Plastid acyl carrier protein n=1 Tax=Characiopsis acuta TaxID=2040456 RepID=A0A451FLE8_9STRA|nr:plastid acyl carrier protein [Characiopsis acuta]
MARLSLVLFTAVAALSGAFGFLMPIAPKASMACRSPVARFLVVMNADFSKSVRDIIISNSGDDPEVAEYLSSHADEKADFTELGFDSLDLAEFSMALQSEFDLPDLDEEALAQFKTVKDVVDYVEKVKA